MLHSAGSLEKKTARGVEERSAGSRIASAPTTESAVSPRTPPGGGRHFPTLSVDCLRNPP